MDELFAKVGSRPIQLSQLAIPGTHHSAVDRLSGVAKIFSPWAVCQQATVSEQFKYGVRFFHFAVSDDVSYPTLYAKHYFGAQALEPQLRALGECLCSSQKEIVILYFKRDSRSHLSEHGPNTLASLLESIFGQIGFLGAEHESSDLVPWYRANRFPGRVVMSGFRNFANPFGEQLIWRCPNSYRHTKSPNAMNLIERIE